MNKPYCLKAGHTHSDKTRFSTGFNCPNCITQSSKNRRVIQFITEHMGWGSCFISQSKHFGFSKQQTFGEFIMHFTERKFTMLLSELMLT